MPSRAKIPPKLHPWILESTANGLSAEQITVLLQTQHNITVNRSAVWKLLRKYKKERKEAAQATIADVVANTVAKDLTTLEEMINALKKTFFKEIVDHPINARGYAAELFKFLSLRLNLSGAMEAAKEKNEDDQSTMDSILEKFGIK